jgi:MYXO-CTERM domain-containing protein
VKIALALPVALLASLIARTSLAGLPEDPGSFATESVTLDVPVGGGVTLSADVVMPKAAGARPIVVLRHGYTSHKENMVGWAAHLATHGFVGVSFESRDPNAIDSTVEGADLAKVTQWLVDRGADNASPLFGRIDGQRVAIGGHSAGGAAATVAATQLAPKVLVLLDTQDTPEALASAPAISAPTVALFTAANGCNEMGDNLNTFKSVSGPRFGAFVTGATHCDGEDPLDVAGCGFYCGAPTDAHHATFKRYVTAFLEAYLLCDPAAYPWVGGAQAISDGALAILPETAKLQMPPPACATGTVDGGPGAGDAGATDAGTGAGDASAGASPSPAGTVDGGSGGSDGGTSGAGGSGGDAGSGGCACSLPGGDGGAPWRAILAPAAVALYVWSRRRARR